MKRTKSYLIFALVLCVRDRSKRPLVLVPRVPVLLTNLYHGYVGILTMPPFYSSGTITDWSITGTGAGY